MRQFDREEQEYICFVFKLADKANEIAKDYYKLSDKNKYRVLIYFEEIVHKSSLVRILQQYHIL